MDERDQRRIRLDRLDTTGLDRVRARLAEFSPRDERDVAAPPSETRPLVESPAAVETVEGIRALVVPVSGEVRDVVLGAQPRYLAELRTHTGSDMIEHVRGPLGLSLWVDEEGALELVSRGCQPRPPNPRIDLLLLRADGWSIRGDVVITGEVGADGDATSLPWTTAKFLRDVFAGDDEQAGGR